MPGRCLKHSGFRVQVWGLGFKVQRYSEGYYKCYGFMGFAMSNGVVWVGLWGLRFQGFWVSRDCSTNETAPNTASFLFDH